MEKINKKNQKKQKQNFEILKTKITKEKIKEEFEELEIKRLAIETSIRIEILRHMKRIAQKKIEELEKIEIITETEKIGIEGIREATGKELEEREIERIDKIRALERIARKIKFYSNINLRIEFNKTVLTVAEYISDRKNLKKKPIDLSLKDKCIAYFPELPSGVISSCSYLSIKAMNIISSDSKITKKNVSYLRRNDFTKSVKICFSSNRRN